MIDGVDILKVQRLYDHAVDLRNVETDPTKIERLTALIDGLNGVLIAMVREEVQAEEREASFPHSLLEVWFNDAQALPAMAVTC